MPEEETVKLLNGNKNKDTIVAIAGTAVGVMHRKANIAARWISNLLISTTGRGEKPPLEEDKKSG